MEQALRTPAWLLIGLRRARAGVLEYADGRLALTTEDGRVFEVPLSEVRDVKFPWYYFGGGAKFKIGVDAYRLSFVKPNEAASVSDVLSKAAGVDGGISDSVDELLTAGQKVQDIGEGRRAGKAWKAVLMKQNRG